MSDMYLTKVERRSIFTHGLIYVLFTFVISDLTVVGPHLLVLVPWIYILGILGVNKFYHPVLTLTLSCVTTFMASLFKYNLGVETLMSTVISTAIVGMGIVTGLCIKDLVLEHRLVKYMSIQKKLLNISLIVVLTVFSIGVYSYQYGNVIGYVKSKQKAENYVKTIDTNYEILKYQYTLGTFDEYVYKVRVLEKEVTLNVKEDMQVINFNEWKSYLDNRLGTAMLQDTKVIQSGLRLEASYEFKGDTLSPDFVTVLIHINEEEIASKVDAENVAWNIHQVLSFVDEFGLEIGKCVLVTGENIQTVKKEDFYTITADYLMQVKEIENLED